MDDLSAEEVHEFYLWSRDYWCDLSAGIDGQSSHVLNFGVWDKDTDSLYDAQEIFRKIIVNWLGVVNNDTHGLEIGCGIGGYAVKLAVEKNTNLHALDLLPEHLELAAEYADEMKVAEKISFEQGSSMQMSLFSDNSFDFAYCIESSFHYADKEKFFQEIYRILKPGGVFVIADITCENNRKIAFKQGNHFPSTDEFCQYFESVGFKKEGYRSIGSRVFTQLLEYVKTYNNKHSRRDKLTKYWERVLTNYVDLYHADLMDYKIYQLKK